MTLTYPTKLKNLFAAAALALALCHSNTAHSMDIDAGFKAGLGRQYSGALGAQVFLGYQRVRVHAGAGVMVFSAGADVALASRLSTGIYSYVGFASPIGAGGHLTYHFNSSFSKGFEVGINVTRISPAHVHEPDLEDFTETMISVGYHF